MPLLIFLHFPPLNVRATQTALRPAFGLNTYSNNNQPYQHIFFSRIDTILTHLLRIVRSARAGKKESF